MNRFELLALLKYHGLDKDRLPDGIDSFINAIAAEFANKDRRISELDASLARREKRRKQSKRAVRGRSVGRPGKDQDLDAYFWYWFLHSANEFGTNWLDRVEYNKDGTKLTAKDRSYILKLYQRRTPAFIKKARRGSGMALTRALASLTLPKDDS